MFEELDFTRTHEFFDGIVFNRPRDYEIIYRLQNKKCNDLREENLNNDIEFCFIVFFLQMYVYNFDLQIIGNIFPAYRHINRSIVRLQGIIYVFNDCYNIYIYTCMFYRYIM